MQCPFCNYENIDGVDQCERCSAALTDLSDLVEKSDIELDLLHRPLGEMVAQDFETVEPTPSLLEVGPLECLRRCCRDNAITGSFE